MAVFYRAARARNEPHARRISMPFLGLIGQWSAGVGAGSILPAEVISWSAALLALVSLLASWAALRRARQAPGTAGSRGAAAPAPLQPAAGNRPAQPPAADDPALIAVLSAAVAMILAESRTVPAGKPAPASVAGFTIRKVRRV
jgi:hypothetical protein